MLKFPSSFSPVSGRIINKRRETVLVEDRLPAALPSYLLRRRLLVSSMLKIFIRACFGAVRAVLLCTRTYYKKGHY